MEHVGARIESLSLADVEDILARMQAALVEEENMLISHQIDGDKSAAEKCTWNCVLFNAYIELLQKAKITIQIRAEYDRVLAEKDEPVQIVSACKLITRIAKEGAGIQYLMMTVPLVKPAPVEKPLTDAQRTFLKQELQAALSINENATE